MSHTITPITVDSLTTAALDGTGVFDVLMRANKAHLEAEFTKNRIKGSEYATVYLGSLESVLSGSLKFLLERDKVALEAEVLVVQLKIAEVQLLKANVELLILQQTNLLKIPAEIAKLNAETALIIQQKLNAITEEKVLEATKCKLQAEFDLIKENTLKTAQEKALLLQKVATEKAQVLGLGVDADSVIGKQKSLYAAQTSGFSRDAEQKAAKIIIDAWSVTKTASPTVPPPPSLDDSSINILMGKLVTGLG